MMADGASERQWYSVRCVFRVINEDGPGDDGGFDYEERLTLWMASSDAQAIAFAEAEAAEYSLSLIHIWIRHRHIPPRMRAAPR